MAGIGTAKNVIWTPHPGAQTYFLPCPADEVLISGNRGGGKAQPLWSSVQTPWGARAMGEIKVGSRVLNPDGTASTVIGVFPQGTQKVYRVKFSDSSVTYCTAEHLWYGKVANRNKSRNKDKMYSPLEFSGYIYTTEQLIEKVKKDNFLIPCPEPVTFMNVAAHRSKHDFDPYLLGLLLGDGCLCREDVNFTTADQELFEYVQKFGFYSTIRDKVPAKGCCGLQIRRNNPLYKDLKYSKLRGTNSHTKFIPKKYLYGSIEDRLALLQGLMDTDGEATGGKAYYSSASYQLINDVRFLVQSLGGWATLTGGKRGKQWTYRQKDWPTGVYKDGSKGWGLYIRFPEQKDLFRLKRKKDRAENYMHGRLVRKITSIKYIGEEECQCIKVNNPNGLYLTDDFIVTHNTDVLLMDFLQHVGQGYGSEYRGILFREEYTQLTDIINKSRKWISQIFPGARYNGSEHKWTFPDGEQLYLRYMRVPSDYWNYHGHEYCWIGWEELTNWATDECYKIMMSCNRSSNSSVPLKYRATCNPSGPGHGWVKQRFIDTMPPLEFYSDPETEKTRVNIPSYLDENTTLLDADPNYKKTILASAQDDPVKYKAWVLGEWDIMAGGALTDVWDPAKQILPTFEIPKSWQIHRSFDWGSTKPWGVTYGVECNGEQPDSGYDIPYIPKGSVIIIDEIYGWTGKVNEGDQAVSEAIAERVLDKDKALEIEYGCRVYSGPADTSIYEVRDGSSIGSNLASYGCHWKRAYKGSGSRVAGLALIRTMLNSAKKGNLERPGLFFFSRAVHHIRTFPLLQYDDKKPEDIDSDGEDHVYDSTRYLLTRKYTKMKRRKVRN